MDVTVQDTAKLGARLADQIASVDESTPVDVIVELRTIDIPGTGSRSERISLLRAEFEREAQPVTSLIEAAGGEVLGAAWINQTLRCRIPAMQIPRVASDEAVTRVELPELLQYDAHVM
jgi:hypothetical protein